MFHPHHRIKRHPRLPLHVGAGLRAAHRKHAFAKKAPLPHKHPVSFAGHAAASDLSVAIIGAGMAGLFAAYLLDQCGISYEIFESTKRVGGRVHTYKFKNNPDGEQYGDLGAMRIPPTHKHLLELIDILKLTDKKIPYVLENPNALFYVNQQPILTVKESEAPEKQNVLGYVFIDIQGPPTAKKAESHAPPSGVPPNTPYVVLILKSPEGLGSAQQKFGDIPALYDALNNELQDDFINMGCDFSKFVLKYDSYSVQEYFTKQINAWFDEYFINEPVDRQKVIQSLLDFTEVVQTATGENQLSLVDMCADTWDFSADDTKWTTLNGGLGQIPDALSQTVKGVIHTRARVVKIESVDGKGVKLHYTNKVTGKPIETQFFTSVICTTPSHMLRFIEMSPPFSYDKFQATRALNYDHSTKVYLQYEKRFWDPTSSPSHKQQKAVVKSGLGSNIGKGGTTASDLPVFKVVYPSYGSNPNLCVLLASYTWTNDAVLMANMDHVDRVVLCQNNLRILHGQDVVPEVVDAKVKLWQQAYALFFAGQFSHSYVPMVQPEHGVYFAGEHLSAHHAWIVGAMYSAADAVGLFTQQHTGAIPDIVKYWANESPWFDTTSG